MGRLILAAVAAVTLLGSTPADDKVIADEFKALKGDWTVEKAVSKGSAFDLIKDLVLTIDEGKYATKLGGLKDAGTLTLDPSATPKSMVIKPTEGPLKGKVLNAIYKLDGDNLTLCYNTEGKEAPKKFESTAENKFLLVDYKRKK
jgi:uncharacterized protein (TIGR03067 family)